MLTDWPPFSTGPRDSIFALGVICVKFVELESVFQFVFETVLGLDPDQDMGKTVFAKLGTRLAREVCEDCLPRMGRSDEVKGLVSYFLFGHEDLRRKSQFPDAFSHAGAVWEGNDTLQKEPLRE